MMTFEVGLVCTRGDEMVTTAPAHHPQHRITPPRPPLLALPLQLPPCPRVTRRRRVTPTYSQVLRWDCPCCCRGGGGGEDGRGDGGGHGVGEGA